MYNLNTIRGVPRLFHFAGLAALVISSIGESEPTFRVSVDLVQVDAVVTDAKGHHVSDLNAEDFRILEDGKPQKITHFAYVMARWRRARVRQNKLRD
jgi:hypothetical protein